MGQSTNAILFYGYCWDDETSRPWTIGKEYDDEDEDGWDDRLARIRGLTEPARTYPTREVPRTRDNGWDATPKDYSPEETSIIEEWRSYWAAKRAIAAASPVEVLTHCSGECPMPYVCVKEARIVSARGDMTEVFPLDVDPQWKWSLLEFCEEMGIDVSEKEPAWWLVSNWT